MDKQIKKKRSFSKFLILGIVFAGLLWLTFHLLMADRRPKLHLDKSKLTIREVKRGPFQEFIPQTGTIMPGRTVYLDAVEGGTIKSIIAENGSMVKKGAVILELSNLNRELSVLTQEANLNESINRVRQTRLQLTQNDLQQQETLAQIQNQLQVLRPQYERQKVLFEKNLIARQDFERIEADYQYNLKRWEFTYAAYKNDSISRTRQMQQLNRSENRMIQSLEGVGLILENLVIKAPFDGQLSTQQLEVGQSVDIGERLGQVDNIGQYKVRVPVDELYMSRITAGLSAYAIINNQEYELTITYIYPSVTEGKFEVDMAFVGTLPEELRRGQTIRMRIALGNASEELLLTRGSFYKDTGGQWVFVYDPETGTAEKRSIRIGRQNPEHFELLEGLQPGEWVITSGYENFKDKEVLIIK